jgi:hypothetical protein
MRGFYPLGTVNDFRPFYLSAPSGGPTTGGTVSVAYADASTNTTTPVFLDGSSPVEVRKDLHWTVSAGNGLAGGTYNLSASGDELGMIGDVSDLRLTLAASVVGSPGVNTGTVADPIVNRTGLTAANLSNSFYIGSTNIVNSPLPVELLSFTAFVTGDQVQLKWATALEINNAYFFIQKSEDGQHWTKLERIKKVADKGSGMSYTTIDTQPYTGTSYYRLVQLDYDGKETYSEIRSVKVQPLYGNMLIYPNPAVDLVNILFLKTGRYEITLLDNRGRQELHTTINGDKLALNISGLEPGIYYIRSSHDQHAEMKKILVRK